MRAPGHARSLRSHPPGALACRPEGGEREWLWLLVVVLGLLGAAGCGKAKEGSPDYGAPLGGGGTGVASGGAGGASDAGACIGTTCAGPCSADPCTEPHTVRVVEGLTFRCGCVPGYHATGGGCEADTRCTDTTCAGHGTCSEAAGVTSCVCDAGFVGASCDACDSASGYQPTAAGGCSLDPCTPSPCSEPGRMRCSATSTGPVCDCDAGTHEQGGQCVPDASCSTTTCVHGTCNDTAGGPQCVCSAGWTGPACDACDTAGGFHADGAGGCTTDPCLPSPCGEPGRGVCTAQGQTTSCACDPGLHDAAGVCVADEMCAQTSCSGHGTCSAPQGVVVCACDAGFVGAACDACDTAGGYHADDAGGCTTDPCLPSPCTVTNRSVCVATSGSATCECDPGYHDDGIGGCTTDPCAPDPCVASNMACRDDGAGNPECFTPACDDGNPSRSPRAVRPSANVIPLAVRLGAGSHGRIVTERPRLPVHRRVPGRDAAVPCKYARSKPSRSSAEAATESVT